jgi:hypothetical protein
MLSAYPYTAWSATCPVHNHLEIPMMSNKLMKLYILTFNSIWGDFLDLTPPPQSASCLQWRRPSSHLFDEHVDWRGGLRRPTSRRTASGSLRGWEVKMEIDGA